MKLIVQTLLSEEYKIKRPILRNGFVLEPQSGMINTGKTVTRIVYSVAHHLPARMKEYIKSKI